MMNASSQDPLNVAAVADSVPARSAGGALPRAPVLSYLANVSTPTRVRRVAAGGMVAVAAWELALVAGIVGVTVWQVYRIASDFAFPGPPKLADYQRAVQELGDWSFFVRNSNVVLDMFLQLGLWPRLVLILALLVPVIGHVILARPVYLGRSRASRMCMAMLVPLMLATGLVTGVMGSYALVFGLGRNPERVALWWLLIVPVGVFVVLVLKDLCACLLWIGRAPLADKPPVRFMPKKAEVNVGQQEVEADGVAGGERTTAAGAGELSPALPRAHVLSYLTAVTTPTRVRVVAGTGVLTIGLLEFVPCVLVFLGLAWNIWDRYQEIRKWAGPLAWDDLYELFGGRALGLLVLAALCAATLTLMLLTGPIRHGRRAACSVAFVLLLPTVAGVLLATAGVALLGLYIGLYSVGEGSGLTCGALGLELLVPVGVLLLLLLKDLCGFLRWIGEHPLDESPPEKFLPGGGRGGNAGRGLGVQI